MNPGEGWGSLNTPRYIRFAQYDKGDTPLSLALHLLRVIYYEVKYYSLPFRWGSGYVRYLTTDIQTSRTQYILL
jgi:hypothetical protein